MREISTDIIRDTIEKLCIEANCHLPGDVKCAIESCRKCEDGLIAQGILDDIIENYKIADEENVPTIRDLQSNVDVSSAFHEPVYPQQAKDTDNLSF